jgi:precorrin-6A synthase
MIRVLVIGIGTGDPRQLTTEAVSAMNEVDLFLVANKGAARRDLAALRAELCRAVIAHDHYRVVEVPDPERDRAAGDYGSAVVDWHRARVRAYAAVITEHLGQAAEPTRTVGFLVWGDPAFYDSTIRVAQALQPGELRVVPGISSIQLLAARHCIVLNRIGGSVRLTTGRRLVREFDGTDTLVMLDGDLACQALVEEHPELEIFWGAQLGLPSESLVAGRLADVLPEIRRRRAELREQHGWVMDTYLLRTPE